MLISTLSFPPRLPLELIFQIIDTLAPTPPIPIALPPSHPVTKTLISLTSTSRALRPAAVRLLYKHSLYIDCERPLFDLLVSLGLRSTQSSSSTALPSCNNILGALSVRNLLEPLKFRPRKLVLKTEEEEDEHLWIKPILNDIGTLLSYLSPTLTHYVVDLPLRTLGTRSQKLVRTYMDNLPNLEFVCDIQESFNTSTYKLPVLPKIRHLALYNPDVSADDFTASLSSMPFLESLILVRADGLEQNGFELKISEAIESRSNSTKTSNLSLTSNSQPKKPKLLVIIVNVESDHRRGIPEAKVGKWMEIRRVNVPTSYYGDEDVIELCQAWVRRRVLSGVEPGAWEL